MQSEEQLAAFRRMTPEERWTITRELMDFAWRYLMTLSAEDRERRLGAARRQHRLSNEAIAEALN